MADVKQKLRKMTHMYNDLKALVEALRSGTDTQSTMLLAHLRLGTSVDDLVKLLEVGEQPEEVQGCHGSFEPPVQPYVRAVHLSNSTSV